MTPVQADYTRVHPMGLGCYGETVLRVQSVARQLATAGDKQPVPDRLTQSEQWYQDRLNSIERRLT
jgi:hypothetical protein